MWNILQASDDTGQKLPFQRAGAGKAAWSKPGGLNPTASWKRDGYAAASTTTSITTTTITTTTTTSQNTTIEEQIRKLFIRNQN